MKRFLKFSIFLILGIALGYGSIHGHIISTILTGIVNVDHWISSKDIGSPDASMLVRAAIAKYGLFANYREETVYFSRYDDPDGNKLNGGNHYRLRGTISVPCDWWSITAYGDLFLIPNPDKVYSFTSFNIKPDENGKYTIDLAPTRPKDSVNWLPTKPGKTYDLVLRYYLPSPSFYNNLESAQLPTIELIN